MEDKKQVTLRAFPGKSASGKKGGCLKVVLDASLEVIPHGSGVMVRPDPKIAETTRDAWQAAVRQAAEERDRAKARALEIEQTLGLMHKQDMQDLHDDYAGSRNWAIAWTFLVTTAIWAGVYGLTQAGVL